MHEQFYLIKLPFLSSETFVGIESRKEITIQLLLILDFSLVRAFVHATSVPPDFHIQINFKLFVHFVNYVFR